MISGEGLRRTPQEVLGTLLHEAAHALAFERGVKDTSRQGRYHNKQFKTLAEELGLTVTHDDRLGWSVTTVTDPTARGYAAHLDTLAAAMILWRHGETTTSPDDPAQHQPDRRHLLLRPEHPRRRLHLG